jgi:hypothetical protein
MHQRTASSHYRKALGGVYGLAPELVIPTSAGDGNGSASAAFSTRFSSRDAASVPIALGAKAWHPSEDTRMGAAMIAVHADDLGLGKPICMVMRFCMACS